MMKNYSLKACESLINRYVSEFNGHCLIIKEGSLGLGQVLLYGAIGKKIVVINEIFLNEWVSGHTVRRYNKLPKKYEIIINQ